MATHEPRLPNAPSGGPYLSAALICERVLQEQDGVISVIRVIDRLYQHTIGPGAPDEMPAFPVNLTLLIILRSGSARGRHEIRVTVEAPSGQQMPQEAAVPMLLEGEERGVNLFLAIAFQAEEEGLYWFNIYFGDRDELLTRAPLRIVYQPQRLGASTGPVE